MCVCVCVCVCVWAGEWGGQAAAGRPGVPIFRLTSFNGFIMQRSIPILSPLVFMPSHSSFHNSKNCLFTSIIYEQSWLSSLTIGVASEPGDEKVSDLAYILIY